MGIDYLIADRARCALARPAVITFGNTPRERRALPQSQYGSVLSRQPRSAWSDKTGVGRLEVVDGSADGAFHVDILVILAAKGEVRGRRIAVRRRHVTDDKAARIVFD